MQNYTKYTLLTRSFRLVYIVPAMHCTDRIVKVSEGTLSKKLFRQSLILTAINKVMSEHMFSKNLLWKEYGTKFHVLDALTQVMQDYRQYTILTGHSGILAWEFYMNSLALEFSSMSLELCFEVMECEFTCIEIRIISVMEIQLPKHTLLTYFLQWYVDRI